MFLLWRGGGHWHGGSIGMGGGGGLMIPNPKNQPSERWKLTSAAGEYMPFMAEIANN